MKIICVKCNCEINTDAGYYNFSSGAQCAQCGEKTSRKLAEELEKDPFGLNAAVNANRLKNHLKKL